VYSCGSNENFVLGINPAPEKLLSPKLITSLIVPVEQANANGGFYLSIQCSATHSMMCINHRLFTWGMNEGQLGHPVDYGTPVVVPKEVGSFIAFSFAPAHALLPCSNFESG